MAFQIAQRQWVFPAVFEHVTLETVPHSQIIIRIAKQPGVQNLLIACFMMALNECMAMTAQRWLESGLVVTWVGARCQVILRYANVVVGTHFFQIVNAAADFQHIIDQIESFDELAFNMAPMVEFDIALQFQRHINAVNPLPRLRTMINRRPRAEIFQQFNLAGGNRNRNRNAEAVARRGDPRLRVGARTSVYSELKKKMTHQRSLGSFFHYTDAVLNTPETDDNFCFPMAFIKCQMRVLTADVIAETKGKASMTQFKAGHHDLYDADDVFNPNGFPICTEAGLHRRNQGGLEFFCTHTPEGEDHSSAYSLLFNPYKAKSKVHEDGFSEYYDEVTPEYATVWYMAAQDVFNQVCAPLYLITSLFYLIPIALYCLFRYASGEAVSSSMNWKRRSVRPMLISFGCTSTCILW